MKYTEEELSTLCKNEFNGKAASSYGMSEVYYKVLKPALIKLGYDETFISKHITYTYNAHCTLELKYKSNQMRTGSVWSEGTYTIVAISGKRKKGKTTRCGWGRYASSSTEYTWKDFEVTIWGGDNLEDALGNKIQNVDTAAKLSNNEALIAYMLLRDQFPNKSDYEIGTLLKTLSFNHYTLADQYQKLKNKSIPEV